MVHDPVLYFSRFALTGNWWSYGTLYYVPAGAGKSAVVRDLMVLLASRWTFRHTVFHFHACGLSATYHRALWVLRLFMRWAYAHPSLVLRTSALVPDDWDFMHPLAVRTVPNGLPGPAYEIERATINDETVILFVGTISVAPP